MPVEDVGDAGRNLQRCDRIGDSASNRKCSEDDERKQKHGLVTEYTAKLCVDDQEAFIGFSM